MGKGKLIGNIVLVYILLFAALCTRAEKYAVILSLRSGEQRLSDINRNYCEKLEKLLKKTGFRKDKITLFFEGGNENYKGSQESFSENIEKEIRNLKSVLKKNDSLWFFIFGYANLNRRGLSLATKGKRLKGVTLGNWLDELPCRQFIFCLNVQSHPLMRILCNRSDRFVFTATNNENQLNPPLLPKYLLQIWSEKPETSLFEIFQKGALATQNYYSKNGIAIPEVPQLYDGKKILQYPFDDSKNTILRNISLVSDSENSSTAIAKKRQSAKNTEIAQKDDKPLDFSEFNDFNVTKEDFVKFAENIPLQPATEETKAIIKKTLKQSGKYSGYNAFS